MARLFRAGLLAAVLIITATGFTSTAAGQSRTVLVVADRTDPSSIPEQSPVYQNALREVAKRLAEEELDARSGKAFTRSFDEALDAALRSRLKIEAVLALKIYVSMHRRPAGNSFYIWIDGEAREPKLGKVIAKHKYRSRDRHEVEANCGRDCILEMAEGKIVEAATEFGEEIAQRLDDALDG